MSLLDNVKQTLSEAASTAIDVGQTLGAQAQAQIAIKRLQLDQAKKLHDLGSRTFEWHRAGTLVAAGTVPREIQELCHELDDIHRQLDDENRKLEEARAQAELRSETRATHRAVAAPEPAADVAPEPRPSNVTVIAASPAGQSGVSASSTPTVAAATQVLPATPEPSTYVTVNTPPVASNPDSTQGLVPGADISPSPLTPPSPVPPAPSTPGPDMPPGPIPPTPGPDLPGTPMPPSPTPQGPSPTPPSMPSTPTM